MDEFLDTIDVCCGGGFFSDGFARAGFNIVLGIDINPEVEATFRANHPRAEFLCADILQLEVIAGVSGQVTICRGGEKLWSGTARGVIGSPPCKGISKGRKSCKRGIDLAGTKRLVEAYMKFIAAIRPRFWVMENVEEVAGMLDERWPVVAILDARDFGAPSKRVRCFAGIFSIPEPTHARKKVRTLFGTRERWVTGGEALGIKSRPVWVIDRYPKRNNSYSPVYDITAIPARTITTRPHYFVEGGVAKPESPFTVIRQMTSREMATLLGVRPDYVLAGKNGKENACIVGNAVSPRVARAIAVATRAMLERGGAS